MSNVLNLNPNQKYIDQLEPITDLPTIMSSPVEYVDHNGHIQQDPSRKVIYTDKSSKVINVVKDKYKFDNNQPTQIVGLSEATILASGVPLDGISRTAQIAPDGSKMILQYTLPEFTVDLGNGDETQFQLLFYNSYDGSWSFTVRAGAIRMACLNGQVSVDDISMFKAKHTPSINPDHARRKMVLAIQQFHAEGERWARWKEQSVTNREALRIFADAAGCKFVHENNDMTLMELFQHKNVYSNRSLMYMWNQYTNHEQPKLGSNEWAVYNALTHWSTHAPAGRKTDENNVLGTLVRRQDKVRNAVALGLAA
jgi:hypothetical protein